MPLRVGDGSDWRFVNGAWVDGEGGIGVTGTKEAAQYPKHQQGPKNAACKADMT